MIHLLTSLNSSFLLPTSVFLHSVCRHHPPEDLDLHVLDLGTTEEERDTLRRRTDAWGARVTIHPSGATSSTQESHSALCRRRIDAVDRLCREVPRLLFADADMLVAAPLAPLWEIDLGDNIMAAVTDFAFPLIQDAFPYAVEKLEADPNWRYVNAGVMLIDAQTWNREQIGERIQELIARTPEGSTTYGDQDFYTLGCRGRIADLDPTWNAQMIALQHVDKWPDSPLKQEVLRRMPELYEHPKIYHWPGPYKPWLELPGCEIPAQALYQEAMRDAGV